MSLGPPVVSPAPLSPVAPPAAGPAPALPPTAGLVVIGNEILSGRTQDTNVAWLARRLGGLGIALREVRIVPDVAPAIVEAVGALKDRCTHVFTTGGIGPTHDDITAAAVAGLFGVPLRRHPEAEARLRAHYGPGADLNPARLKMADIPEGASLIDNPVSAAPGFRLENVFVLAGVPAIMRAMVDAVAHDLGGGAPILAAAVSAPVREGDIAAPLAAIQADWPDLDIGSYPFAKGNRIGASVVIRGTEATRLVEVAEAVAALMRDLGETPEITPPASPDAA